MGLNPPDGDHSFGTCWDPATMLPGLTVLSEWPHPLGFQAQHRVPLTLDEIIHSNR